MVQLAMIKKMLGIGRSTRRKANFQIHTGQLLVEIETLLNIMKTLAGSK